MRPPRGASGMALALGVSVAAHFGVAAMIPAPAPSTGQEASVATDMAVDDVFSPAPVEETGPAEAAGDDTLAAAVAQGDLAAEVDTVERASEVASIAEPAGDPLAADSEEAEVVETDAAPDVSAEPVEDAESAPDVSEARPVTASDTLAEPVVATKNVAVAVPVPVASAERIADDSGFAAPVGESHPVAEPSAEPSLTDLAHLAVPTPRPPPPETRNQSKPVKAGKTASRKEALGKRQARKRQVRSKRVRRKTSQMRRAGRGKGLSRARQKAAGAGRKAGSGPRNGGRRNASPASSRNSKAVRGYPGKVRGRIARAARRASRAGRGTVRVRFTVRRDGTITAVSVSGGSARLNGAVKRAVSRARAPAIPAEAGRSSWAFSVPVKVQ